MVDVIGGKNGIVVMRTWGRGEDGRQVHQMGEMASSVLCHRRMAMVDNNELYIFEITGGWHFKYTQCNETINEVMYMPAPLI